MIEHLHPANVARHDDRTRAETAVDRFVAAFGSIRFLAWQTAIIAVWIALNAAAVSFAWDLYPFILLNLVFSTQAAYAAPLILLSQNRQSEHDRVKAEEDFRNNADALAELRILSAEHAKLHGRLTSISAQVALNGTSRD